MTSCVRGHVGFVSAEYEPGVITALPHGVGKNQIYRRGNCAGKASRWAANCLVSN